MKYFLKFGRKKAQSSNFFELKSEDQKKILSKAVKEANEEQRKLVRKYLRA